MGNFRFMFCRILESKNFSFLKMLFDIGIEEFVNIGGFKSCKIIILIIKVVY